MWKEGYPNTSVGQFKCMCMALLSQCLNEHVSSFSRAFQNCPSPTQRLADCCSTWHMSLCWFTCRPLINKWGLAQEVEKLSWPICDKTREQEDESGERRWGATACLSSSPNLVFVRSGESEHVCTRSHPSLQTLSSWLVWVTKWSSKSTQLFIINLSAG